MLQCHISGFLLLFLLQVSQRKSDTIIKVFSSNFFLKRESCSFAWKNKTGSILSDELVWRCQMSLLGICTQRCPIHPWKAISVTDETLPGVVGGTEVWKTTHRSLCRAFFWGGGQNYHRSFIHADHWAKQTFSFGCHFCRLVQLFASWQEHFTCSDSTFWKQHHDALWWQQRRRRNALT